MTDYIEITQDGIFSQKWDMKTKQILKKIIKPQNIYSYLRTECKIAPGLTFGQFLNAIDQYSWLKIFISQYSWCPQLDDFHTQALEPMRSEKDNLTKLEIYWHTDLDETDFDFSPEFHGLNDKNEKYSVSYCPIYDLVDLPLILNTKFIVYEPWQSGKKPDEIIETNRCFSFLEVLDAIYFDISFVGGPKDKIDFIEYLKDKSSKIDLEIGKYTTLDELDEELNQILENENENKD